MIIKISNINFGRGYVYSIQYHIVWCVKYRRYIQTQKERWEGGTMANYVLTLALKKVSGNYEELTDKGYNTVGEKELKDFYNRKQAEIEERKIKNTNLR